MHWTLEFPRVAGWYVVHVRDARGRAAADELLWIDPEDAATVVETLSNVTADAEAGARAHATAGMEAGAAAGPVVVGLGATLLFLGPLPRPPVAAAAETGRVPQAAFG